jgi:hypothetical protein
MATMVELGQGKEPAGHGAVPKTTGAVLTPATRSTSTPASAAAMTQVTPEAHKTATPPSTNQSTVNNEVPESSHHGGQKSKGKPFCYHCHTKGHTIHECIVVLYRDICCGDHVTKISPIMEKMNTTAIPCGYVVEGLGFYFIPVAENPKVNLEEKSAVVRVLEGSLTADQLAVELEKLLLGKNKWVIEEKGKDVFITNFPSSDLLDTMVNWGTMDTKISERKNLL